MFSTAPVRGSYSSGACAYHHSPPQLTRVRACACGKKDHLEDTRWRSSRGTAPHKKTSLAAQRTGSHRRVATRKDDGRLPSDKGNRPRDRAEWTKVLRYGHLLSAPVVVDAGSRTEWRPPTLRASLCELRALSSDASVLAAAKNTRGRELLDGAPRQKPRRRCVCSHKVDSPSASQ